MNVGNLPVDGLKAVFIEKAAGFGKMPAPEKAVTGGKRAWVGGSEDQVSWIGDHLRFLFGIITPKEKHDWGVFFVENLDHSAGELLPAAVAVGFGLIRPDGKDCVQKQDPLFGPGNEVAVVWNCAAEITLQLFENV